MSFLMMYQLKQVQTLWGTVPQRQLRQLRAGVWLLALALGGLHTWVNRYYLENVDALSYLDMAAYFAQGDWAHALNGYWSPLYPLLLAGALNLVQPAPSGEFTLMHLTGGLIFLGTLAGFEFFLREVLRNRHSGHQYLDPDHLGFSDFAVLLLGYALFFWTSFNLIRLSLESPDMLAAGFVYVLAGLLLRLQRGATSWGTFFAVGVVCGFGYWCKAPLFVLSFLLLPLGVLVTRAPRRWWPRGLAAFILFLVISSPWLGLLSQRLGRLSFGESGRLNYVWIINEVPQIHAQPSAAETLRHPTRQIFAHPDAFEFAAPVGGSYPPWYDPSYWYDGVTGHFSWRGHLQALGGNAARLFWLFIYDVQVGLLAVTLVLISLGWRRTGAELWRSAAPVWVLAIAGLGLFIPLYIEGRYVAPYLVLLWLTLWAGLRIPAGELARRLLQHASLGVAALLLFTVLASSAGESAELARALAGRETPRGLTEWEVAAWLQQAGLPPGAGVAVIGGAHRAFWARLSRTRVIAEVPARAAAEFWAAEPATQQAVIQALAQTGAYAIVTLAPPARSAAVAWERVGQTDYFVHWCRGAK